MRAVFRFTIKDLLWLMVVVGLGFGWWLDHRDTKARYAEQIRAWDQHARAGWGAYSRLQWETYTSRPEYQAALQKQREMEEAEQIGLRALKTQSTDNDP